MSTDPVLASPPADCCLDCFPHEGTPKGTWEDIAGVQTYVSLPPSGGARTKIIMYFPDVWGIDIFVNGQLLVDYFAQKGE